MALIELGEIVVGIRGTTGGLTYSANKAGAYVKPYRRPSIARTSAQSEVLGRNTSYQTRWNTLTQSNRDDWDDYAADAAQELTNSLGLAYYLTGLQWYCRINHHRYAAGQSFQDTPPDDSPVALPTDLILHFYLDSGPALRIRWRSPGNEFDVSELYTTFALYLPPTSRLTSPNKFWFMNVTNPSSTQYSPFKTEFLARWGDPTIDHVLFASIQSQSAKGRRSPPTTLKATYTDET